MGYDPIRFDVVMVICLEVGLITSPIGLNFFVIKAQSENISIGTIFRGIVLFLSAPLLLILSAARVALWLLTSLLADKGACAQARKIGVATTTQFALPAIQAS